MFDPEFYPTPQAVIERMAAGLDLLGRTVLEPSAGSGNIAQWLKSAGANVLVCEKHTDLARIVGQKAQFLKPDFFDVTPEEVSHIDYIIMNPPFSNADKHILHALDVAPGGAEIIAICNAETINNRFSRSRTELGKTIKKLGHWENIGDAFSTADRKTNVDIALIHIFKPKDGDSEFDDYFFDMNEEQEQSVQGSGIMRHNEIMEIVNRYVAAVKMFDEVMASNKAINSLIQPISKGLGIAFGAYQTYTSRGMQATEITRETFKKELQKSAWTSVFDRMNMQKYVTSGVMADINRFVEQQQNVPFTMTNIFKMIEIIIGTHSGRMDKVLVEVFDRICSLSADNSEAGEGWKTNSNYKVNRRFIDTWICEHDNRWPSNTVKIRIGTRNQGLIEDATKALCFMTGKNYDKVMEMEYKNNWGGTKRCQKSLYNFFGNNPTPWGEWVQWNEFFKVRGYKKGTMHFEFIDEDVWMEFNIRVAKIKGWALPKKTDKKSKGNERARQTGLEIFETV